MKHLQPLLRAALGLALAAPVAAAWAGDLKLTGEQEVPPVQTMALGTGSIDVAEDGTVSGSIKTTGVDALAAHIHHGAEGSNGPVVIPLTKGENGTWTVPEGTKLTAEQMKAYRAGELYVNVHSAAQQSGEVRAQIKP
ncbi:CHRD domain-containing protein [uncultured Azohydromonas sp.]|jgi:CHRD domain.|uniref:CHRD domain-containing protein n=1 Tax=uncultured Azohydromonas sp. TaxID=487342 RepID=UPI00262EA8FD|nr:CHRD domain-containing protein [uncultured Azohydromonas sp.]